MLSLSYTSFPLKLVKCKKSLSAFPSPALSPPACGIFLPCFSLQPRWRALLPLWHEEGRQGKKERSARDRAGDWLFILRARGVPRKDLSRKGEAGYALWKGPPGSTFTIKGDQVSPLSYSLFLVTALSVPSGFLQNQEAPSGPLRPGLCFTELPDPAVVSVWFPYGLFFEPNASRNISVCSQWRISKHPFSHC